MTGPVEGTIRNTVQLVSFGHTHFRSAVVFGDASLTGGLWPLVHSEFGMARDGKGIE
jgi:hypothetical protein